MTPNDLKWPLYDFFLVFIRPLNSSEDFILKLDNIEEESNYLFEKLGIEGIKYPKGYGHKSSNSILNEISGEISIRTGQNIDFISSDVNEPYLGEIQWFWHFKYLH